MRIKLISLFLLISTVQGLTALAQTSLNVKGKVMSEDGETLPGATIYIKGTSSGTITDVDGDFTLQATKDAILVVSFVGFMTQELAINGRSVIQVELKSDLTALEEIVVVGYGEQKKETLVSSVSTVKGKELQKSPQPNLSNSFAGRLSGVIATTSSGEPGFDGSSIFIRGISSNGNNNPLIVIDGVASQLGGLERLDPNNIESVSVLKDASASIFGSRAANGVILVTTKKGELGKPEFTFSHNQGFVRPTRIPEMANAAQYGEILNEIGYYNNPSGGFNQTYSQEEISLFESGVDPVDYPNTDWLGELIAPLSFQDQQSIAVKGGGSQMNYFISAGRRHQESIYENGITEFEQINLRTKVGAIIFNNLKIGSNLNLRQEDATYPTSSAENIFRAAYRAKPNLIAEYEGVGYGVGAEGPNNPLLLTTAIPGTDIQPKITLNAILDFEYTLPFLEAISIKGFYSRDQSFKDRKRFELPYVVYEPVQGSDPLTFNERPNNIPDPQLFVAKDEEQLTTSHIAIHYKEFFGDHLITAFAAFEQSRYESDYLHGFRRGFLSGAVPELVQGPEGIDENDNPYGTNAGGSFEESRRNYFGRVNYNYKGKYLIEGQVRYDGSSKFAEKNQYGFFWSSSAGWRLSEEDFFNVSIIDDLKLRGSYGVLGNDRIPDFQFLNRYQNIGAGYVVDGLPVTRYVISQIANRGITWEESKKLDLGLEVSLFNKVKIEADYFSERREGLLIEARDLPWVSGIINEWDATNSANDNVPAIIPQQNIGITENRGWEGQVSYSQNIGQVKFFISANATYAKSEVIDLKDPETLEWKKQEGKPLFAGLYYESIGIFRSQEDLDKYPSLPNNQVGDLIYRDVDEDGEITANDQVRANFTNIPQLFYGVNIAANWKGLGFSILLQGQDRVQQYFLPESGTIGNFTKTWADNRYSPKNIGGSYPRVDTRTSSSVNGGNEFNTDFWLYDTQFIRIRNVEIGYSFPEKLIGKVGLKYTRLYVNGLNLATFTPSDDFDPEVRNAQGQGYPQHKIYNVGLMVKF